MKRLSRFEHALRNRTSGKSAGHRSAIKRFWDYRRRTTTRQYVSAVKRLPHIY